MRYKVMLIAAALSLYPCTHRIIHANNVYQQDQSLLEMKEKFDKKLQSHVDALFDSVSQVIQTYWYAAEINSALEFLHSDTMEIARRMFSKEQQACLKLLRFRILLHKGVLEHDSLDAVLRDLKSADQEFRRLKDKGILSDYIDLLGWGISLSVMFSDKSYDDSLEYFIAAMKIREEIGDTRRIANCLFHLGLVFERRGTEENMNRAFEYYLRGHRIAQQGNHKLEQSHLARHLGYIYQYRGDLGKALLFFKESLALRKEIGFKIWVGSAYEPIAALYCQMNDVENALKHYNLACQFLEAVGYKPYLVLTLNALGDLYDSKGQSSEALDTYRKAFNLAKEIKYKEAVSDIEMKIRKFE